MSITKDERERALRGSDDGMRERVGERIDQVVEAREWARMFFWLLPAEERQRRYTRREPTWLWPEWPIESIPAGETETPGADEDDAPGPVCSDCGEGANWTGQGEQVNCDCGDVVCAACCVAFDGESYCKRCAWEHATNEVERLHAAATAEGKTPSGEAAIEAEILRLAAMHDNATVYFHGRERAPAVPAEPRPERCAMTCDHGSRCTLPADHTPPDRHETEHGCIAYDGRPDDADREAARVEAMTDDEVLASIRAEGRDPHEVAEQVKAVLLNAVDEHERKQAAVRPLVPDGPLVPTSTVNSRDQDVTQVAAALADACHSGGLCPAYYRQADDALKRIVARLDIDRAESAAREMIGCACEGEGCRACEGATIEACLSLADVEAARREADKEFAACHAAIDTACPLGGGDFDPYPGMLHERIAKIVEQRGRARSRLTTVERERDEAQHEAALWKRQHDDLHREACRLTAALAVRDQTYRLRNIATTLRDACTAPNHGPKHVEEHVAEVVAEIEGARTAIATAEARGRADGEAERERLRAMLYERGGDETKAPPGWVRIDGGDAAGLYGYNCQSQYPLCNLSRAWEYAREQAQPLIDEATATLRRERDALARQLAALAEQCGPSCAAEVESLRRERDEASAEAERERNAHAGTASSHAFLRTEMDEARALVGRLADALEVSQAAIGDADECHHWPALRDALAVAKDALASIPPSLRRPAGSEGP